eukprot:scaffold178974_cov42-Prasinocladus_malaysianus.AAC.2
MSGSTRQAALLRCPPTNPLHNQLGRRHSRVEKHHCRHAGQQSKQDQEIPWVNKAACPFPFTTVRIPMKTNVDD